MNGTFRITGGTPLRGDVVPIASKNAFMGALPVAALESAGMRYHAVPDTTDVNLYFDILTRLGARVTREPNGEVHVDSVGIRTSSIDPAIGRRFRGAFTMVGPLLARFGSVEMPLPGGCDLGYRAVATHLDAFSKLDISVQRHSGSVVLTAPKSHAEHYDIWLLEASVGATLNVALYAAGSGLSVTIADAASEPHVTDVLSLLQTMGVEIIGLGTNRVTVNGRSQPLAAGSFTAGPDEIDIAGTIAAAAVTGGSLTIRGGNVPRLVGGLLNWFRAFGVEISSDGDDLTAAAPDGLRIVPELLPKAGRDLPKLAARPWPGFPVDALPVMVTLACKSEGPILIQNWMYESGFDFVRELKYLGADIHTSDPQRIIVMAPRVGFRGGEVVAPDVIQGTKAIFLAALADPVETVVHGVDILRRRYPTIFETYCRLGATIQYDGPPRVVSAAG